MTVIPSFARDTVVRLRAPLIKDRYQNEVRDWENAEPTDLPGVLVQPLGSSRSQSVTVGMGREALVRRWSLIDPQSRDLLPTDRVEWRGDVYEVDGDVGDWPSPTGGLAHLEVILKRVEG